MVQILRSIVLSGLALVFAASAALPQSTGRPQDGFYSGRSNGQAGGQSNGQVSGRVDGRANKNEGVPPATGDATKKNPPVQRNDSVPNDAESMDAIVRPGLQR